MEKVALMIAKRWETFPCWEMFSPEGTIEVWDEEEFLGA